MRFGNISSDCSFKPALFNADFFFPDFKIRPSSLQIPSAGQNLEQPRSSSGEAIVKVTAVALFLTSASLPPCHSACR